MVKKNVIKINTKRKELEKMIEKEVKDPAQLIKLLNARLEKEPNNRQAFDARELAMTSLNSGIMGLPYRIGQLNAYVEALEAELQEKPKKSTPEHVEFIAGNKRFSAAVSQLHERKKNLLDDSEAQGLWENIKF